LSASNAVYANRSTNKADSLMGVSHNDASSCCLERDRLGRSLLCSVCLRSERFSYVVVIQMASSQCPQSLIGSFMASRRDRHTSVRRRLPLMGWLGRAPTIGNVEPDGNQHRSTVDPCQSSSDSSSVLASRRSQFGDADIAKLHDPLRLSTSTFDGSISMRSGGQNSTGQKDSANIRGCGPHSASENEV
jgi:hypothetical protein